MVEDVWWGFRMGLDVRDVSEVKKKKKADTKTDQAKYGQRERVQLEGR